MRALTDRPTGRAVAAALAGCLLLVLAGCASGTGETNVVVTRVRVGTLTVTPGGAAAVFAAHEATVTVARHGTVTSLSVVPGQHVQEGQQVAVVRELGTPTEQRALASQLEGLQTLLTGQRQTMGPYSPQVGDTLSRIAAVREQLAQVIGAPAVLTAPQTGVVAALDVGPGSDVDTSKPLMRIVDMSSVRITIGLAGEYRNVVHAGDGGRLVVAGSGGREVPATVTALVPSAQTDGGFQVTATAVNADALVATGTTAYLRLQESVPGALTVPTRAVLGTSAKPYVYVVDNGHASLVPVMVGPSDGTWTQVLSGLHAGQRVVLTGNQNLADRQAVHVSGEQVPS
jgi:membrane fusion protein (multidrug efflux system)